MSEKICEYEVLAQEKLRLLPPEVGSSVSHGSEGDCPSCGHAGIFDLKGAALSWGSIYFSSHTDKWRCMACDHVAYGY